MAEYNPWMLPMSLGQTLAEATAQAERRDEKLKQLKINSKAADTLFKANPELQQQLGVTQEEWDITSPLEKIGAMSGAITRMTLAQQEKEMAMRQQHNRASEDYMRAQINALDLARTENQNRRERVAQTGGLARNYMTGPVAPMDPANAFLTAAMETGAWADEPSQFDAAMREVYQGRAAAAQNKIETQDIEGTGMKAVRLGNTLQLVPKAGSLEPFPLRDENGELMGYRLPNGKGGFVYNWVGQYSNRMRPAIDEQGQPIEGYWVTPKGTIIDAMPDIQRKTGVPIPTAKPQTPNPKPQETQSPSTKPQAAIKRPDKIPEGKIEVYRNGQPAGLIADTPGQRAAAEAGGYTLQPATPAPATDIEQQLNMTPMPTSPRTNRPTRRPMRLAPGHQRIGVRIPETEEPSLDQQIAWETPRRDLPQPITDLAYWAERLRSMSPLQVHNNPQALAALMAITPDPFAGTVLGEPVPLPPLTTYPGLTDEQDLEMLRNSYQTALEFDRY